MEVDGAGDWPQRGRGASPGPSEQALPWGRVRAAQGGQTSQMRAGRAVPQNTGPQESVAGVAVVGGEVVSFGCQAE